MLFFLTNSLVQSSDDSRIQIPRQVSSPQNNDILRLIILLVLSSSSINLHKHLRLQSIKIIIKEQQQNHLLSACISVSAISITGNRVDLIKEDGSRSIEPRHLEKNLKPVKTKSIQEMTYSDKLLSLTLPLRGQSTRMYVEEGGLSKGGHCLGEQSLSGSRRPEQQNTLSRLSDSLEVARHHQWKKHSLFKNLLRCVQRGNVLELHVGVPVNNLLLKHSDQIGVRSISLWISIQQEGAVFWITLLSLLPLLLFVTSLLPRLLIVSFDSAGSSSRLLLVLLLRGRAPHTRVLLLPRIVSLNRGLVRSLIRAHPLHIRRLVVPLNRLLLVLLSMVVVSHLRLVAVLLVSVVLRLTRHRRVAVEGEGFLPEGQLLLNRLLSLHSLKMSSSHNRRCGDWNLLRVSKEAKNQPKQLVKPISNLVTNSTYHSFGYNAIEVGAGLGLLNQFVHEADELRVDSLVLLVLRHGPS